MRAPDITLRASDSMPRKSAGSSRIPPGASSPCPSPQEYECRSHDCHAPDPAQPSRRQRSQFRDDGARALRAVFSSDDNWPNLSEAERDEWRSYFDRMLELLHRLGYATNRELWSMPSEARRPATAPPRTQRRSVRK